MTAALHSLWAHLALGCAAVTVLAAFTLPHSIRLDGMRVLTIIQCSLLTLTVYIFSPLTLLPVADVVKSAPTIAGYQMDLGLDDALGLYDWHLLSGLLLWGFSCLFVFFATRTNVTRKQLKILAAAQGLLLFVNGTLGGSLVHSVGSS